MKKLMMGVAIAIGFLITSCSSERKQEHMADTSMAADAEMLDTINRDTVGGNSTTSPSKGSSTDSENADSVNRSTTVNRDSVRQ